MNNPMMVRFRSLVLLLFTVVLAISLITADPAIAAKVSKKPTYTTAQLQQIQRYTDGIEELRVRMQDLPPLIQSDKWVDVKSLIHGPLGDLRIQMLRAARLLAPTDQKAAQVAAQEVFEHLVVIDEAADARNITKALRNYNEALLDFEVFYQAFPA